MTDTNSIQLIALSGENVGGRAEPSLMVEAEFRELYAETARPLKSYLSRLTGNASLADELLQESYFRLLRTPLPAMDMAARKNYLYRIATNLTRDHFRTAKHRPEPLTDSPADAGFGRRAQVSADLRKLMKELSPNERAMVWLAYAEGSSHREIALVLGLKEASVRPLLHRARRKLADLLRDCGFRPATRKRGEIE